METNFSATGETKPSKSLCSERFPGLFESQEDTVHLPVDTGLVHELVHVSAVLSTHESATATAVERFVAWAHRNDAQVDQVKALHVGIADPIDASGFALLRKVFPQAGLLTNFGVGLNHLDMEAAGRAQFRVTNTPGVLTDATADVALLLLLLVTRDAAEAWASLRSEGRYEGWKPVAKHMGQSLAGKTLGLAGYGRIARAFAARAEALGMRVVVMESVRKAQPSSQAVSCALGLGNTPVRLPESAFLAACDVLSLHFPLAPETHGWLDATRIARLKPGTFVLNTARGEVVCETALGEALRSGHLAGAGLDVFQGEPVLSSVLREAPRLVVLPHMGSATWETRRAMGELCKQDLLEHLRR